MKNTDKVIEPSKEVIDKNDWITKAMMIFEGKQLTPTLFRKAIEDNMPKPTEDKVKELIKANEEDIKSFSEDLKEAEENGWETSAERYRTILKCRNLAIADLRTLLPTKETK